MTKKDFQLIADVLKAHQDGSAVDHVVRGLVMSFAIELAKGEPPYVTEHHTRVLFNIIQKDQITTWPPEF